MTRGLSIDEIEAEVQAADAEGRPPKVVLDADGTPRARRPDDPLPGQRRYTIDDLDEILADEPVKPRRIRAEVYVYDGELVVLGRPADLPQPEGHHCDAMGCGSTGGHVLARVALAEGS